MASRECPHGTLLATTLNQYHEGLPLISSTHESYLKIIEDLKNDLEQISCEVILVQEECNGQDRSPATDDTVLERSLRELETQNDRLEQALKHQTKAKAAVVLELQTQNETLKCQIAQLECMIVEKDQYIDGMQKRMSRTQSIEAHPAGLEYVIVNNNLSSEMERKLETLSEKLDKSRKQEQFLRRETRKLNDELNESKRKNRDLIIKTQHVSNLLKSQEANRLELAAKYESLEKSFEDQAKKLRTANNQLCMLNDQFQNMERRQFEHNTENNLLREEVFSLKEKHACAIGVQKSAQDQLLKVEKELYNAHDVIKEQKVIIERNKSMHMAAQCRLQEANAELERRFRQLINDHRQLQSEHERQKEINSQQLKLLDSFRQWQEQQKKVETATLEGFLRYEKCIKDMLVYKNQFLGSIRELFKDYSLLQNEFDRLKSCPLSNHSSFYDLISAERSITERLDAVRSTTRRVMKQNASFKEEEPSGVVDNAASGYRPTEGPL